MATILFDRGDVFTSKSQAGLAVSAERAIVVHGDNRTGWKIETREIPADAIPTTIDKLSSSMQLVLRGAAVGIGIELNILSEEDFDPTQVVGLRHIHFQFEGRNYQLPVTAGGCQNIQLPDGRVLKVERWLESLPPQPDGLAVVKTASIPVAVQV